MSTAIIIGSISVVILLLVGVVLTLIFVPTFNINNGNNGTITTTSCYNGDGPTNNQSALFRATNHMCQTLWLEARSGVCGSPLPGYNTTLFKLDPGKSFDFNIPETGLPSARFWAKYGCDETGNNCLIGDQVPIWTDTETCEYPYGCHFDTCPAGPAPTTGFTPPIDSLFEITFGCSPDVETTTCNVNSSACTGGCNYFGCPNGGCDPLTPVTFFDTSQVDGWTLPYRYYVKGTASDLAMCNGGQGAQNINASTLSVGRCPTTENLSDNGQYPTLNNIDLTSVDLRYIRNGQVVGCFAPCRKLTAPTSENGYSFAEGVYPVNWYCCPTPTPNNCQLPACVTPSECSSGPIVETEYVTGVHEMAPGVYAYTYDDQLGSQNCPAGGSIVYELEFGGQNASPYPINA